MSKSSEREHGKKRSAIVRMLGEAGVTQAEVARQFGVSEQYVSKIALDSSTAVQVLRMVTNEDFIAKEGHIMDMLLDRMMQPDVLEKATLNQLSVAYGILSEKRLLHEGKATVIFGNDRREQINDLAVQLMEEAQRRGITIEATADG